VDALQTDGRLAPGSAQQQPTIQHFDVLRTTSLAEQSHTEHVAFALPSLFVHVSVIKNHLLASWLQRDSHLLLLLGLP
jgi:hypothetical protein